MIPLSASKFTQCHFDILVIRSKRLPTLTSMIPGRSAIHLNTRNRPDIRRSRFKMLTFHCRECNEAINGGDYENADQIFGKQRLM